MDAARKHVSEAGIESCDIDRRVRYATGERPHVRDTVEIRARVVSVGSNGTIDVRIDGCTDGLRYVRVSASGASLAEADMDTSRLGTETI